MLLDSVIIIDFLNGSQAAVRFVAATPDAVISVITLAEVLAGVHDAGFDQTRAFLSTFPLLGMEREIAESAAKLRRNERWKIPDAIQAASALHYGLRLATRNTKNFDPNRHSFVEIPYEL